MDIKKIKEVATVLSGWSYHEILSKDDRFYQRYFLTNKAGLYIQICQIYGEKLERWKLGFLCPSTKSFVCVASVGSDLKKSPSSISRDLVNRLLKSTTDAYSKLENLTLECQRKSDDLDRDALMFSSLKKVCNVRAGRSNGGYQSEFYLEDETEKTLLTLIKNQGCPQMDVTIRGIDIDFLFSLIQQIKDNRK